MQSHIYQGIKITRNSHQVFEDELVVEAPLQININNEPYTVVMRTPDDDMELVRGLLFAEDIYKSVVNFNFSIIESQNSIPTIVNVTIPDNNLGKGYLNKRTLLSVSSCGICGKKELKDIEISGEKFEKNQAISLEKKQEMYSKMSSFQHNFKKTGGSHAAAIFDEKNQLLSIKEDIGRHNAVDKVIGDLLQKNHLKKAQFLLVSGRVSYEIVTKAFIAKIPIIVAVSACSSLAVDFAKEFGICLIGFTREDKMTVYANPNLKTT
ncbi:formate dehydrogenase accessory sulfurtransferase FdhD [Polaribacter gangjinensis]|uniref:Sulfur carrier protein FdhD n=1 Tax=Polaribacter gangjinensis TaxID=574710 RepID=A0A2S7WBW3_9FLAO|nr:formate dehydrogenase accessory sulfurtransferase FdhD [Polaribacter gangjinensis]PQJ74732.1 formate dehydrogenase family accessory protein FdhD [Polaribacter gangjinensis]